VQPSWVLDLVIHPSRGDDLRVQALRSGWDGRDGERMSEASIRKGVPLVPIQGPQTETVTNCGGRADDVVKRQPCSDKAGMENSRTVRLTRIWGRGLLSFGR
jgi:hypothetical protein